MLLKYPFETVEYENERLVKFDEKNVRKYLDWAVSIWKDKLKSAEKRGSKEDILIAKCYIDAYLSVKMSLFGNKD